MDAHLGTGTRRFRATLYRAFGLRTPVPERLAFRAARALARKRAGFVVAHRARATRIALAFVYVRASGVRVAGVSGRTHALRVSFDQRALRVGTALYAITRV